MYRYLKILSFGICTLCFMGCPQPSYFEGEAVGENVYQWIAGFDGFEQGDSIYFSNGGSILVKNRVESTPNALSECRIEDIIRQCQYEILTLQFISPYDSIISYLTIYLFPRNRLVVNYSIISALTPEILRLDADKGILEVPQEDVFDVGYITDYSYLSGTNEALVSRVVDIQAIIGALLPNDFTLVKGEGIVRWLDYSGNVFELIQ